MYIFFWFFKQFFYILKRFTKHKLLLLFVFFIVAIIIFLKPSFASSYTEIEYIESTGTQYIDTGVKPYQTTFECGFALSTFVSADNSYIAGVYNDNNNRYYPLSYTYSTRDFTCQTRNNIVIKLGDADLSKHTFIFNSGSNNAIIFDDVTINTNSNLNLTTESGYNIYLFARNNANTPLQFSKAKIYYAKIFDKSTNILLRNFIPVIRNSDNTVCLYDKVTDTFFTNQGSGSFVAGPPLFTSPYIENSSISISNWDFDYLYINLGSHQFNNTDILSFNYNGNNYSLYLRDYVETIGAGSIRNPIRIPIQSLSNYITFVENSDITFNYSYVIGAGSLANYNMGTYNIQLTITKVNELNNNVDRNVQNAILNTSQQTNEQLSDLNNNITNDDVDFDEIDLPTDDSEDITQDGVNNIFTSIYNAFCTGQAQDIVFPIPFTNKNITLSANYVRDMLTNSNSTWVITIIEAFWWYLISRFIVKDIVNKINKIKSGNIESIEQDNIKGDML